MKLLLIFFLCKYNYSYSLDDHSYAGYDSSYFFFYKEEREDSRNDKKQAMHELFFLWYLLGPRHEPESVLDIAPIHKYS